MSTGRGLRIAGAVGAAVVALLAFGVLGGVGGAVANHTSCGTYCWNVDAPYPGPAGVYVNQGGGGNSYNGLNTLSNGDMDASLSTSNSYDNAGSEYIGPWMEGDPIHFYTAVGVTYTFEISVEASYSVSGWCIWPTGDFVGVADITVEAGLVGTSYQSSYQFPNAAQYDSCETFGPHHHGAGQSRILGPDISGGWGGVVTLTLAIPNLPSGIYTPYAEIVCYTYAGAAGLSGGTSQVNMWPEEYGGQWISTNINWGPGEG